MNPPVVAVDLDGTLIQTNFDNTYIPKTAIRDSPNEDLIKMLKGMRQEGWKIVIHSSRCWSDYNSVKVWLEQHKVPFDDIVLGKFKADLYLDDKAVNLEEMTNEKIKS